MTTTMALPAMGVANCHDFYFYEINKPFDGKKSVTTAQILWKVGVKIEKIPKRV